MTEEVIDLAAEREKRAAVEVMARTETFKAGGVSYTLTHQPMFKAREWRKDLGDFIRDFGPKMSPVGLGTPILSVPQFLENMASVFETAPEAIFDLLVKYDGKLNWVTIKETIYPDELDQLFKMVLEAVFPLGNSMSKAMGLRLGMN